jgi:hypothetical protein
MATSDNTQKNGDIPQHKRLAMGEDVTKGSQAKIPTGGGSKGNSGALSKAQKK